MNVNKRTALWILNFLTERPQFVSLRSNQTTYNLKTVVTNAGAPQGTVIAPTLFSIYTNDCRSLFKNIFLFKFADDTAIQAVIRTIKDLLNYKEQIKNFVKWCDEHYLLLNIKKTKELIFDFRLKDNEHDDIIIKGEKVEKVNEYKYLGIIFDKFLEWHAQAAKVLKSMNQRMYFMRKLHSYHLDTTILSLFFTSCVKSIMCFCMTAWGGNNRENEKRRVNRCLKSASKMLRCDTYESFDDVFENLCKKKLDNILKENTHPLYPKIKRSVRSGRILHLSARTQRYFNSFLPTAIRQS